MALAQEACQGHPGVSTRLGQGRAGLRAGRQAGVPNRRGSGGHPTCATAGSSAGMLMRVSWRTEYGSPCRPPRPALLRSSAAASASRTPCAADSSAASSVGRMAHLRGSACAQLRQLCWLALQVAQ